jgi:superfamily II DNA or RNA helicase
MQSGAPSATVTLDAAQQTALRHAMAIFPVRAQRAGTAYAVEGRVSGIEPYASGFVARVDGTDAYETYWYHAHGRWAAECSCPVGVACKHAYAVGVTVLAACRRDSMSEPRGALVELLRETPEPSSRAALLVPHLRHLPPRIREAVQRSGVLAEPDPELLCEHVAAIIRREGGALPPQLVPYRDRPDLARARLVGELARWADRCRAAPARSLRLVCGLIRHHGGYAVTIDTRMSSARLNDQSRTLQQLYQLHSEQQRNPDILSPAQAAVLAALVDDGRGWAYGTPGSGGSVSNARLLRIAQWAARDELATWDDEIDPEVARRAGIAAGAPLRLGHAPARVVPICLETAGETALDLALTWPDGGTCPVRNAVFLPGQRHGRAEPEPLLALSRGLLTIIEESPPPEVLARFRERGAVPVPTDERAGVFGRLAPAFPNLRDTLARHTRVRRVRPIIALDLRDDEWLQVRVLAADGATPWTPAEPQHDRRLFELDAAERWIDGAVVGGGRDGSGDDVVVLPADEAERGSDRSAAAPAPAAAPAIDDDAVWIDAPDPECVAPALHWLRKLPAQPANAPALGAGRRPEFHDRERGWWMRTNAKGMTALAAAWSERPADVIFVGTPRTRRLLFGAACLRPRLRIAPSGTDWFSIAADWEQEGMQMDAADLARLRAATTPFVRLSGGWVRRDAVQVHDEVAAVLADLGVEIGAGPQKVGLWQLAGAAPSSLAALERLGADPAAVAAARALRERVAAFQGVPAVARPAGLVAALRPYQQRGLDFLAHASALGTGALLADDMGLGKTVQALAWLQHLREADPAPQPSLVVCPTSVMHNWVREAERFTPALRVLALERGAARRALFDAVGHHDLLVTNYALLRTDIDTWRDIPLRALILDEAQQVKNPDSVGARAVAALTARHRVALTGTPLENRALDLWSIVECINPGYLGPRAAFEARFDRPDAPPHTRAFLAAKMRPVLLRRTKAEVGSDLPPRIEERIDCELTREQRLLYVDALRHARDLVERLGAERGGLARHRIHILAALTRLRQICCHPALAGGKRTLESGKFDAFFELLEPLLAEGHKVVVFSQFVACLNLLDTALRRRGVCRYVLTGASIKRAEIVDAFHRADTPGVFLVSLKAGGTGLNLTAASYVVLFDPWWNPAVEAQAIDRTHRIGQHRTVIAYRLLTRGTIEEKIHELQQRKAELARDILGESSFARALTRDDLQYLFAEM